MRQHFTLFAVCAALLLPLAGCADLGAAKADYKAGRIDSARDQWEKLAEFGLPEAKVELGKLYLKGDGVEKDEQRGLALLQEAADAKHPRASFELGQYFDKLEGKKKRPRPDVMQKVVGYYETSGNLGYARAWYALSQIYAKGKGVTKDGQKAQALLERSAKGGYAKAQQTLTGAAGDDN